MPKRRLYSEIFYKEADSVTATYAEGEEVRQGFILYVTHACAENEDKANCEIAFGKRNSSGFIPLEEKENVAQGIRWNTVNTHHFIAGEKPAFRIEGATLADKIRGFVEGYYEKLGEE